MKQFLTSFLRKKPLLITVAVVLALGAFAGSQGQPSVSDNTSHTSPVVASSQETKEQSDPIEDDSAAHNINHTEHASEQIDSTSEGTAADTQVRTIDLDSIPAYSGNPYVYINNGEPTFTAEQKAQSYGTEEYGALDDLGRCTPAFAVVGTETQPTEKRGSIGSVKPTGWQISKYDFIDGKYLYNRCHLLGYQLTGENANERNLITGTRYLNVDGMLPFENAIDDYVDATGNHVLLYVAPLFKDNELVARGVQMMAESVEDNGEGVSFNVYCYNVQPGVTIDYATGNNESDGTVSVATS